MVVWFVDTSVLCNLLPVPGRDQDRMTVTRDMKSMQDAGDNFVLPVTTVIETGNHISQVKDGRQRREAATTFVKVLDLVRQERAPWRLHAFGWNEKFLESVIEGAETGVGLVDHATLGMGCGDLCVLAERAIYRRRTGITDVRVWTIDKQLRSHS
jgi:hypothetical protein